MWLSFILLTPLRTPTTLAWITLPACGYRSNQKPRSFVFQEYKDDNEANYEGDEYFNDFEFVIGGTMSSDSDDSNSVGDVSSSSSLQDRLSALVESEQANQQHIADNWKEGYWNVWGCSLDPFVFEDGTTNGSDPSVPLSKTIITCLRRVDPVSTCDDEIEDCVVFFVGRSDGSMIWLKMDTSTLPSESSSHGRFNDRATVTYFQNQLTAKSTKDGGMIVKSQLRRADQNKNDSFDNEETSLSPPFEILAQVSSPGMSAVLDALVLPAASTLWTVSHSTPNVIQAWTLLRQQETGILLPLSMDPLPHNLRIVHASTIVWMKAIPGHTNLALTISNNGQVVLWHVTDTGSSVRFECNLLRGQDKEEAHDTFDTILSVDVDEEHVILGSQSGQIRIYLLDSIVDNDSRSFPALVRSYSGFSNRQPGVSALCIVRHGTVDDSVNNSSRQNPGIPRSKTLIAGNELGELKQWELFPMREGDGLEYWPRMASQKMPGKAHVFEKIDPPTASDATQCNSKRTIRQLLWIQNVILAASDTELRFWDPTTGKILHEMQGLDFRQLHPSLVVAKDSVLVTNGMDQFVCVHDFAIDRVTSENENTQWMVNQDDEE